MRSAILVLFLLTTAMTGCAGSEIDGPSPFEVALAFIWNEGSSNHHMTVQVKDGRFPSVDEYDGRDLDHPGHLVVHDVLEAAAVQHGLFLSYQYFDGLGFTLESYETHKAESGADGGSFWELRVNGEASQTGISATPVRPGDAYVFKLVEY